MRPELMPLVRRLGLAQRGDRFENETVVAGVIGVGRQRCLARLEAMLWDPTWARVLLIGFAGALDPSLRVGDLVRPGTLLSTAGEPIVLGDGPALLTVDSPATTAAKKARLHRDSDAVAVDMESYHVARACRARDVAFGCLRAISDDAATDLPPALLDLVDDDGRPRPLAAISALTRRPTLLPAMARLQRASTRAADALARATQAELATVPR